MLRIRAVQVLHLLLARSSAPSHPMVGAFRVSFPRWAAAWDEDALGRFLTEQAWSARAAGLHRLEDMVGASFLRAIAAVCEDGKIREDVELAIAAASTGGHSESVRDLLERLRTDVRVKTASWGMR